MQSIILKENRGNSKNVSSQFHYGIFSQQKYSTLLLLQVCSQSEEVGEISPALSLKLGKISLILRKSAQIVAIYWFNFTFKMQLLSFYRKKTPNFSPAESVFLVLQMNVYQSALMPRKLPCPDKIYENFKNNFFNRAPTVAATSQSTFKKI